MWTIPNIGINSGCQHFIDVKSHLRSAASFVQNQRLAYKLVDRELPGDALVITFKYETIVLINIGTEFSELPKQQNPQ